MPEVSFDWPAEREPDHPIGDVHPLREERVEAGSMPRVQSDIWLRPSIGDVGPSAPAAERGPVPKPENWLGRGWCKLWGHNWVRVGYRYHSSSGPGISHEWIACDKCGAVK